MSLALLLPFLLQVRSQTADLCTAAQVRQPRVVILRAAGGKSSEGPVLVDYTCPLGKGNDFVLATVALVPNPKFSDPAEAEEVRSLNEKAVFQTIVEGRLECRNPLKLEKSDDGDIVSGNGYG